MWLCISKNVLQLYMIKRKREAKRYLYLMRQNKRWGKKGRREREDELETFGELCYKITYIS